MEGERLGRVVAVALSASPTPVACAAFGVSIPAVPGLPPSSGSASPAVQPDDGEEATTATTGVVTDIQFLNTDVRRTGLWAAPEHYLALHTRSRDRVCVSPAKRSGRHDRPGENPADHRHDVDEVHATGSGHRNRTGTGDPDETRGTACRGHEKHGWRHQRRPGAPPRPAVMSPELHTKRGNQRWVDTRTRSTTGNAW
jgi:hypothetical protein